MAIQTQYVRQMVRKGTEPDKWELLLHHKRYSEMDECAQKLRSLARQSRALALIVADHERAKSLERLARLYERQAAELEPA
jgi:hypothetical protein